MQDSLTVKQAGTPLADKSTIDEIRARFDNEVERFSRLETGQQATLDAPLVLELVAKTAATHLRPGNVMVGFGVRRRELHPPRPAGGASTPLPPSRISSNPMLERAHGPFRLAGVASVLVN